MPAWLRAVSEDFLELRRGGAPLLISLPHTGTDIPGDLAGNFTSLWQARRDADWHIEQIYRPLAEALDATFLRTRISRSVIDVNRDPSGATLYPGQATTGLCPETDFDGAALYHEGRAPDAAGIAARRAAYFTPYHARLAAEIARLRGRHGAVVLYDGHSIRSRIPRLFDGVLPQLNIGTFGGASCAPELRAAVAGLAAQSPFSHVLDGRFRGGWITRHYGQPQQGVHAVQMELAMSTYLEEPGTPDPQNWPPPVDAARVAQLRPVLHAILQTACDFAASQGEPA